MLAAQRRDLLLDRLRTDGRIVAKDLAAEVGISEDTIRRDLRDLAAAGLCQRVYGGALPVSPAIADYATRQEVSVDGKQRVARAAAALIEPGCTVILDGSIWRPRSSRTVRRSRARWRRTGTLRSM